MALAGTKAVAMSNGEWKMLVKSLETAGNARVGWKLVLDWYEVRVVLLQAVELRQMGGEIEVETLW